MKSGFTAIIGRPNVGKSTLLNKILGQKIVIATDKAQTTRKRIKGILTDDRGQIVFVDTPGIHKPLNKLGEFLLDEAKVSVPDTDLVIFITDINDAPGKGDKWIAENVLKANDTPVILVMNKADKSKDTKMYSKNEELYKELLNEFGNGYKTSITISAQTGDNVEKLIETVFELLPEGEKFYPDDVVTEESMRDVTEEIIREKILKNTKEEIPHSVAVQVENYFEQEKIDKIYATIYCETQSQKGILIGKGGNLLKTIGSEARLDLENITEKKVYLELKVKVEKDWRKKDKALKKFGYFDEK